MSRSIGKVFGTGPYLASGFDTNTDFAGRDVSKMTTEELQRRIKEMFPQASVPQQIQDFAATNTTGINLQNNLTNNTGTYTTESAWGYPNNTQSPMYQQMGEPYTTNSDFGKPINYSLYGEDFSKEFINQMLNDQRFQQIMKNRTQANEGGYSNHQNDRGGETKYGISSRWYPDEDIKNLTRERANAILYRDYWLGSNINQLPDEFADIVFDNGVVQGQPTAIANLQRALGINADGLIGPNTLNAISNAGENLRKNFIQQVHQRNLDIVKQDPTQKVFLNGWTNRVNNY